MRPEPYNSLDCAWLLYYYYYDDDYHYCCYNNNNYNNNYYYYFYYYCNFYKGNVMMQMLIERSILEEIKSDRTLGLGLNRFTGSNYSRSQKVGTSLSSCP